jgi:plastocyanin
MRSSAALLGLVTAAFVASACSSSGTTSPISTPSGGTGGASATIVASSTTTGGSYGSGGNYFFSPTPDTVSVGTSVNFQFGSVTHNVTFTPVANAPTNIPATANATVGRMFPTAGTYNYICTIHNIGGVVVVK